MICRRKTAFSVGICYSLLACGTFGYCRQRNLDAGGMANVTADQQAEWKILDDSPPLTDSGRRSQSSGESEA